MAKSKDRPIPDSAVKDCPEEIPEEVQAWARQTALTDDRVILYKRDRVRGICHACGCMIDLRHYGRYERFSHYGRFTCPTCGTVCSTFSDRSGVTEAERVANVAWMEPAETVDGVEPGVWIRMAHLMRDKCRDYTDIPAHLAEYARYLLRGTHAAMWLRETKGYMGNCRYWLSDWTRSKKLYLYDSSYLFYLPSLGALERTRLRYAAPLEYIRKRNEAREKSDVILYLVRWAMYPVLEMMEKAGFRRIVDEKVRGGIQKELVGLVNFRAKTPAQVFALPKSVLRLLRPEEWTMRKMRDAQELMRDCRKPAELAAWLRAGGTLEDRRVLARHMDPDKAAAYLAGQYHAEPYPAGHRNVDMHLYRDYLEDCRALERDLSNTRVLFPRDLAAAHAQTVAERKVRADELTDKAFRAAVAAYAKYAFEDGEFLIRAPESQAEMILEGKANHHCVATYIGRVAQGETEIWFVRRKSAPDEVFYTLEYRDGAIVQCRTKNNVSYAADQAVKDFADGWAKLRRAGKLGRHGRRVEKDAAAS